MSASTQDKLTEAFESAGYEGMKSFLEDLFRRDDSMERRFIAAFAHKSIDRSKQALIQDLEALVREFGDRGGFVSWRTVNAFEHEYLLAMSAYLDPVVQAHDADGVFSLVEAVLRHYRTLSVDGSYGFDGSLMDACFDNWMKAFDFLGQDQAESRFHYLLDLPTVLRKGTPASDNDWFIEKSVEDFIMLRFADDYEFAHLIREFAQEKLSACAVEAAAARKERGGRETNFTAGRAIRAFAELEETKWTLVLMRVAWSEGCSIDDLISMAQPHLYDPDAAFIVVDAMVMEGEADRAILFLEEQRAVTSEWASKSKAEIEDRLLTLYGETGRSPELKRLLEELLCSMDSTVRSSAALLRAYKAFFPDNEWPQARAELLKSMKSGLKRCSCLMDEGLHELLAREVAKSCADIHPYEDYLVGTGHADVVANYWCEQGEGTLECARERRGYQSGAEMLGHAASLIEDDSPIRAVAERIKAAYPRRTALHDELSKVGL